MAAAALGLHSEIVSHIADKELDILVGIDGQEGIEAEHADCLLMLSAECSSARTLGPADELIESIRKTDLLGMPNDLSPHHRPWQIIEEVSAATCLLKKECSPEKGTECSRPSDACFQTPIRGHGATRGESVQTARQLFRQRRSAVAMDGVTRMSRETFFHMMQRATGSSNGVPYSALDWSPSVSLVVFVHRVDGLAPGLYCLVRHPRHERSLKESFDEEFLWEKVPTCPDSLSLYLLKSGDYQEVARDVSCYQDIASDGVFSVSMLAQFEPVLKSRGAWFYRRLFWETGMIGQVLYLEAEAAGVRATGIGCFHDDMMHGLLGIGDLMWQSLYHFTVGGAVEDLRLQTRPAYEHLS
jgi:nitroreductase